MTKVSFGCHLQVIRVRVVHAVMQILVIEDEPRILAFLARGLEAEGFRVDGAGNGSDGLKQALASPYDAVVLDLLLPGARRALGPARATEQRPDLPVVIVSARSDLPTKLRGFGLGASDYLAKPFSLDELVARIGSSAHAPGQARREHRARGLADPRPRAAPGPDGYLVADLSDREFRLLHHLVEHAGTIVSRERLLSEVWGYHFDPGSNVVEVCVRRLARNLARRRRSRLFAMRVTDSVRLSPLDVGWVAFALANLAAMALWPSWETIPFHFIWVSSDAALRLPHLAATVTALVLGAVIPTTGFLISAMRFTGSSSGASCSRCR